MKICPHCNQEFSEEKTRCPKCGEEYWFPGKPGDREESEPPAKGGCLQILLMPLITALALTLFLISTGIIISLFIKLESNEIRFAWIVLSLLLGFAVFSFLRFRKRKKF